MRGKFAQRQIEHAYTHNMRDMSANGTEKYKIPDYVYNTRIYKRKLELVKKRQKIILKARKKGNEKTKL